MHLSKQDFNIYFTGDETDPEVIRIADHLVECPECQERADQLSKSGIETTRQMSALAPRAEESAQPVHLAYARFKKKYLVKENMSMLDRIIRNRFRCQFCTCFKGIDGLMLGTVVSKQTLDVRHKADRPDITDQQKQTDNAFE